MNDRVTNTERELGMPLPRDLKSLYGQRDGYFSESGQWWVMWPLARLVTENLRAHSLGLPRDLVAFGDDGTGNPFCVRVGDEPTEVLRWSWIDGAVEQSEGSVHEFIAEWCSEEP